VSEQVGASLVLAQMLLPSQSGTPIQQSAATPASFLDSAAAGTGTGPANSTHPADSIGENAPVFASLLTELKNLEARSTATTTLNANALIRVQVDTKPPDSPLTASGTDLPDAGKLLPVTGALLPETSNQPPLLTQPNGDAALPENAPLDAPEIVIREPDRPGGPVGQPIPGLVDSMPAALTQAPAEPAALQPTNTTSATQPQTAPAPGLVAPDPNLRPAEGQPTPAAAATTLAGSTGNTSTSGDSSTGQNPGDRQAQPNVSTRGPSISFSLDGLPSATVAAPATQGTLASASPQVLSQPLTLLGQPSQWAEPLAERLAGLATRGANTAEIRLHPPSLGQLEVRITLTNDQATLFVASANPEVREALQQALPRLDNLLNGLGIELAESEIAERQADGFQADTDGEQQGESDAAGPAGEPRSGQSDSDRLGLLDTWA